MERTIDGQGRGVPENQTPLDMLRDDVSNIVQTIWGWHLDATLDELESPIERALFLGLLTLVADECTVLVAGRGSLLDEGSAGATCKTTSIASMITRSGSLMPHRKIGGILAIHPQVSVGSFRIDFLLRYSSTDNHTFVAQAAVECDGHDFHERTKEQAKRDRSRDRYLQSIGLPILRFTGAEIWQDARRCADECLKVLRGNLQRGCDRDRVGRDV